MFMDWDIILEKVKKFSKIGVNVVTKKAIDVKESLDDTKTQKQFSELNETPYFKKQGILKK